MKKLVILIHQSGYGFEDQKFLDKKEIEKLLMRQFKILSLRIIYIDALSFEEIAQLIIKETAKRNQSEKVSVLIVTSESIYGEFPKPTLSPNQLAEEYKKKFPKANLVWGILDSYPLVNEIDYEIIDFFTEIKYPNLNRCLVDGIIENKEKFT
jgi:hypothetical protein